MTGVAFLLIFLTIVFANILGTWRSKKWLWSALIPGILGGFLLGYSTQVYSLSPGWLSGLILGMVISISIVGTAWVTRCYRDRSLEKLQKK
jgi:ABC-type Mn2+/Zn2+ transport system permease subunit